MGACLTFGDLHTVSPISDDSALKSVHSVQVGLR
jgi:hypothetical protein